MQIDLLTRQDLEQFKQELLAEIRVLLPTRAAVAKQWLKTAEVRALLGVSIGKLQSLRIQGLLPSSKIGGVHYYHVDAIQAMLEGRVPKTPGRK